MTSREIGRSAFVLAAAVSVLTIGTAAAQTTTEGEADGVNVLDVVVVTANKRSEDVQDVAASVSVQSGEDLENRHQLQLSDYANYVPGMNVGNLGKAGLANVNLRGIASVTTSASVATYADETPLGSSGLFNNSANSILDMLPYELERLEVLRGPQGTLYGAGSMGGLIKYVLRAPDTKAFEARLGGDAETIEGAADIGYSVRGMVNFPVIPDVLAVRISAYDRTTPGYIDNAWPGVLNPSSTRAPVANNKDVNEQRQSGARVAVQWEPSQDVSVRLNAFQTKLEADDGGVVTYAGLTSVPTTDGSRIVTLSAPYGDLTQNHGFPQILRRDIELYSGTVNWDLGGFELVSATGWTTQRSFISSDQSTALGPFGFLVGIPDVLVRTSQHIDLDKFTQELRLVSDEGGTFDWMIGGFYTDEDSLRGDPSRGDTVDVVNPNFSTIGGPLNPFLTSSLATTYQEYAIFGDATYRFSDRFDVSGGLRYAENTQNFTTTRGGAFEGSPGTLTAPETSEDVLTWSAAARYHFSPDIMLYGRAATGYRPGGPNSPVLTGTQPPPVGSESLTNYEVGLKSEFLDGRALLNATAFFIDWKDVQLNATISGSSFIANGGDAESKGLELAATYVPVRGLDLGFNAAYTDSQLTDIIAGSNFVTGYQLPGVPEWSYSLTADYEWEPVDGFSARIGGGYRWVDELWLTGVQGGPASSPAVRAPSYSLLNFNGSLSHGDWTLKAYVTNAADERAIQGGLALIDLGNNGVQGDMYIVQPRTIGIGLDVRF